MKIAHNHTITQTKDKLLTYYVRYEDLLINPIPVLEELFCFLLEVQTLQGTVIEQRIMQVC